MLSAFKIGANLFTYLINRTYILTVLAGVGFILFFVLRPYIDFNAQAPINKSKTAIENEARSLVDNFGFSLDSLGLLTTRQQHTNYYTFLRDTLSGRGKYPSQLNKSGVHLTSWVTTIAKWDQNNANLATDQTIFDNSGVLRIRFNNSGQVIRIEESANRENPTFVEGDSPENIAQTVIEDMLAYDLNNYMLSGVEELDTLSTITEGVIGPERQLEGGETQLGSSKKFVWVKKASVASGPQTLSLTIKPILKDQDNGIPKVGGVIESFLAKNALEPDNLNQVFVANNSGFNFGILFFVSIGIIGVLILFVGVRSISKGEVIWGRALFIFVSISLAIWGWRAIYFMNTLSSTVDATGATFFNLNQLIFGLLMGFFAAAAYLGWESTSRNLNHKQLPIVDAIWSRKLFMKEIGDGLIKGYLLGGIAIGVFCLGLFLMGERFSQADSQFGFAEPSNKPKLLTINMSAWATVWLVSLSQIGVIYNSFSQWFKNKYVKHTIIVLVTGVTMAFLGRLIGTSATVIEDMGLFLALGGIIIYFYKTEGIVTVATGWWVFSLVFLLTPYMGSSSIDVAYIVWVQAFIIMGPLLYGFIAYRYGDSVVNYETYIPEYQARNENHMRVEKEIEIARESQYNLMPLQPPKAEGFDVHGFFMPSFEVGGDFFDYVLTKNDEGNPVSMTMTVVDVSGKSMRAAMPAVFTSGLLLSRMHADVPSDILREVTGPLFHRTDSRTFITCVISKLDIKTKELITANAGHCYPVIKRKGKAEFIETLEPKYPLGIKEEVDYQCHKLQLQDGDFIMLYSDGLPEAVNEDGEWFGFENVPKMLEEIDTENLSAYEISQEVRKRIQKFSNFQLADDTTIICLKV